MLIKSIHEMHAYLNSMVYGRVYIKEIVHLVGSHKSFIIIVFIRRI